MIYVLSDVFVAHCPKCVRNVCVRVGFGDKICLFFSLNYTIIRFVIHYPIKGAKPKHDPIALNKNTNRKSRRL